MIAAVIPAKDEESNITHVIDNIIRCGLDTSDIFVIDNDSQDLTSERASKRLVNVVFYSGRGYEETVGFGLEHIKRKGYIKFIIVDGDNEIDFKSINEVMLNIKNYDFICGKRDKIKRFSEKLINYFFYKKFHVIDLMCGLKAGNITLVNPDRSLKYGLDMFLLKNLKEKNTLNVNVKLNRRSGTRLGNNFKVSLYLIMSLLIFICRKNK